MAEPRIAICLKVPQRIHAGLRAAALHRGISVTEFLIQTAERAMVELGVLDGDRPAGAVSELVCRRCRHRESQHWARGCVAGCNCRKFLAR